MLHKRLGTLLVLEREPVQVRAQRLIVATVAARPPQLF
jgi:hypothetical protein